MASSIDGLVKPFEITNLFADVFNDASPFSFD